MRIALPALFLFAACHTAPSPTPGALGFDDLDSSAWHVASTGGHGPDATWAIHRDPGAVSAPCVVSLTAPNHQDEDRFNVFWNPGLTFGDGRIAVDVRADGGSLDQGGGPIWRVRDANNYYVCRVNPLESNFRVYVVENGVRRQLATALCDASMGTWHRIEVDHLGEHITCKLDGKAVLNVTDGTIRAAGGVGLWSKADARTSFDDLSVLAPR